LYIEGTTHYLQDNILHNIENHFNEELIS